MIDMKIYDFHLELLGRYGPQKWWPAKARNREDRMFEIIAGAVLTQATNWKNVEYALENLRSENLLKFKLFANAPLPKIERFVRPSGFYRQKARRLVSLCRHLSKYKNLGEFFNRPTEKIRKELLELNGIGKETADSILLYAGDKLIFPVDAYTFRIFKKKGFIERFDYEETRELVESQLPKSVEIYKEFHALLVQLGKDGDY